MTDTERKKALRNIGAADGDIDPLLVYAKNVFLPASEIESDELSPKWPEIWDKARTVCQTPPRLEMFQSAAGLIPIIYPSGASDFENLLREIVYKGIEVPNIEKMGASFVYGKTLRFIIISDKPYSGVPAADMGLGEEDWLEKSMTIRKYHECAHYYTRRRLGASRNNLHDELIADFCGIYAAFGEYRAEWFIKFLDTRLAIYTKDLSEQAARVIRALAALAAKNIQEWTKTEGFAPLGEAAQIEYLAGKELLEYV
jgi:hypothetical protein